jgi:hypothetical protein
MIGEESASEYPPFLAVFSHFVHAKTVQYSGGKKKLLISKIYRRKTVFAESVL